MNHNEFFRIATLDICGSLKIEQAMCDFINTVSDVIPVDHMFLQYYEPEIGSMRTLAKATCIKGEKLDILTPLPKPARDLVHQNLTRFIDEAVIIHKPEENPVAREMLKFHGIEGSSIMRMTLITKDDHLGGIVLTANGPDRYTPKHVKLLTTVKKPFTIALSNTLEHRKVLKLKDRLTDDNLFLHRELQRISGNEIIGADFGLKEIIKSIRQVATTDSPVLLTGETGVGKDVVANSIHLNSNRRNKPFIVVNCGAIPETLIDSELFGHEKGAFTGALTKKRGRFERAHEGTIFLDEIGEMPLPAQVRLLRVLQNKEIERVGGSERIDVDIRIIAATNRDLYELKENKKFREDLWFRLNVFPIQIPPLRDRKCDIPALVQHFIERKSKILQHGIPPTLAEGEIDKLLEYDWPGNVRELENIIERAIIICQDKPLRFNLNNPEMPTSQPKNPSVDIDDQIILSLDEVMKKHIEKALEISDWRIHGKGGAGDLLKINPNTLRNRMRKCGIPFRKNIHTKE